MLKHVTVIARDASGAVISQVNINVKDLEKQSLQGVMAIARNMLRIKGCARAEIYTFARKSAQHEDTPLAVVQHDDLFRENASQEPSLQGA